MTTAIDLEIIASILNLIAIVGLIISWFWKAGLPSRISVVCCSTVLCVTNVINLICAIQGNNPYSAVLFGIFVWLFVTIIESIKLGMEL